MLIDLPDNANIVVKNSHSADVGHIVYGAYETIGGVDRGIVCVVNPVLDPCRPETGGVMPADYFVSVSPLWLFGQHKGRTDKSGVHFRNAHSLLQMRYHQSQVRSAIADNRSIPSVWDTNCLSANVRTITSKALAYEPTPGGAKQQFSFLEDEAFEVDRLFEIKGTSIGYAIAAARHMGCPYVVVSGIQHLRQDAGAFSVIRNWAERNTPGWLRSFEPCEFAQRYVSPNKVKGSLLQGA